MSNDPFGPTGNTSGLCFYCGTAHEAFMACPADELKKRVQELESLKSRCMHYSDWIDSNYPDARQQYILELDQEHYKWQEFLNEGPTDE